MRHWPKYFIQYFIMHICHWQLFVTPVPIPFSFSNTSQFYLTSQNLRNAISRNISRKHSMEYTRCIPGSLRSPLQKQSTIVKEMEKTILREQVQNPWHYAFLSIVITRYVWIQWEPARYTEKRPILEIKVKFMSILCHLLCDLKESDSTYTGLSLSVK